MDTPLFFLASSSPRRLALLSDIGITPTRVIAADIDETAAPGELPRPLCKRLAAAKLAAVSSEEKAGFVLAADTVVACGRRILPKALDGAQVGACLTLLKGRRHSVMTAVALRTPEGRVLCRVAESVVRFRDLSASEIAFYVDTNEGVGKAGGYAIQGFAGSFIDFISGSYSNIVGLPLFETAQLLRGGGYPLFRS